MEQFVGLELDDEVIEDLQRHHVGFCADVAKIIYKSYAKRMKTPDVIDLIINETHTRAHAIFMLGVEAGLTSRLNTVRMDDDETLI